MNNIFDTYLEQKNELIQKRDELYRANERCMSLQGELECLKNEPYYIKAMKFRANVKKRFIYKVYSRLRYGKITENKGSDSPEVVDYKEFNYDYMLNANEYRFLKYKKQRNKGHRIDIKDIQVPYVKGLVSVILPVYNGEDYVSLAIESVLSQTYDNFEMIIVNDGSSDRTPEIVDAYAEKDKRIRVIHQENRKLPMTLSRGFREARGEFLTWTSADNIVHPQFLEKYVAELQKNPNTAMIYGNIRLIDENGDPLTDFDWYSLDENNLENVILPDCVLELNTYANNYVAAAFMYRAVAASIVEDYSKYKFGIEDYDYWMKINEILNIRHVSFSDIEYSYRMHSKSLTSQDKELKITENRYRQMLLDDFRRDYLLKKQYWIVDGKTNNENQYNKFCELIDKNGDEIISIEEAKKQIENLYERMIYVNFGESDTQIDDNIPKDAYKVLVSEKSFESVGEHYDIYISMEKVVASDFISAYKGWYGITKLTNMYAFIESKAKNIFMYNLEGDELDNTYKNNLISVIITDVSSDKELERCISSINCNSEYEIIVATNRNIKDAEQYKVARCLSCDDVTKKNVAARMANGEFLVFIQSDCVFCADYFDNMIDVFNKDSKIAVIHGNVEVMIRGKYRDYCKMLGENLIEKDDIYIYDDQYIPSSYSFAMRKSQYVIAQAFQHVQNEFEQQFANRTMFGMSMALYNVGRRIYLSAGCGVVRVVDELDMGEMIKDFNCELFSDYNLKVNGVCPYNVWPEVLDKQKDSYSNDEFGMGQSNATERLLAIVRDDFREKEKVDLNRDIYTRIS